MSSQNSEARSQSIDPRRLRRSGGGSAPFFWLLASGSLLVLPFLSGCAPSAGDRQAQNAVSDFMVGDYRGAQARLSPLATKTDENFVLNNLRLGLAALADYNIDDAESAFLRAYEVINSVGVNDGGRTIGAALVNERIKVWKGEPFERAMANFYLGLIYYMRHDYANARAAFENSLFKLRDYGEGKVQGDEYRDVESNFTLAYYMLGRSWQRLGDEDKARKNFDRVAELKHYLTGLADPARNAQSNLLLVVDYGFGPRKMTTYEGSVAGFGPRPEEVGPVPPPVVVIDGRRVPLNGADRPPVDLLASAQDRRWQDIDTIRAVKNTLGTGLIGVGAYEGLRSRNSNNQLAGLAMIGAGALLKASSQADTRQWEMLPRTTFVLPIRAEPGPHDVTIEFPNIPGLRQTWRGILVPPEGEETYYFRMQRYNPGPFYWPPKHPAPDGGVTTSE